MTPETRTFSGNLVSLHLMAKLAFALAGSMNYDSSDAFLQKDTFTGTSSPAEFRNMEAEAADFALLNRYFGEAIQEKRDSKLAKRKQ
jgi:hypothetical protein